MMPGLRYPDASSTQNHAAGSKRPLAPDDEQYALSSKRRRVVRHGIRHKQAWREDPSIAAPQDEAFFQAQILRACSISLTAVGFESAKPTALEAFRGQVDEYVRVSMEHARRTTATPSDFARALAHTGYTASDLEPQLALPLPAAIALPPVPDAPPAEEPPPRLEAVLGAELSGAADKNARAYIPTHLPAFPSKHTWQATPVYSSRETDPRKIRERATQEGILAEQALRKLMAANRTGSSRRRGKDTGVAGDKRRSPPASKQMWEDAMREIIREDEMKRGDVIMGGMDDEQSGDKTNDFVVDTGLLVNYDKKYWRKGVQSTAWS
ncbi:bromodomain associated protein [Diplodia corticola]|uniref:Transcription initiation factor TFIID subunit 8 n=1 Tax=Diplodia corticola TaxID=236234 RepID=A0A1J9RNK9_9PEZI|nr:bromodomain associated protein [Diplodia corticola]OJD34131.1 bromodomain associated protein [Diplodia corticola]